MTMYFTPTCFKFFVVPWFITAAQLHSIKPQLRFLAGSNLAHGVLEACDGENL